jgi:hypothetical protein
MNYCPVCQRYRVRVNKTEYSFIRYRCDYCGSEWHSPSAFGEGMAGADRIAPTNPNLLIELLLLRDKLQQWGGKVVEFLDSFEGSFEEDDLASEGLKIQREGFKLGLRRVR